MSGEITRWLQDWRAGDEAALERLTPLVYDEMRRIAKSYMRKERGDHTLQATALVHEAYVRLIEQEGVGVKDRVHFVALAAQAMKRVLVDHGRKHRADKRGGGEARYELQESDAITPALDDDRAIDVAMALEALSAEDAELARIVELRYLGGLTSEEIADVMGISVPTVTRRWSIAKAWLFRHLTSSGATKENDGGDHA